MKQTSLFGTKRLTYSQADSPVSHIQPQVNDLGKRTSDISGRRCLERLEKLNHVGSLAKTFTVLLVGMTGWSSKRCKLTWKMKGTKSNRIYFQLHPSTLSIEEIESGLLPTPRVKGHGNSHQRIEDGKIDDLTTMAKNGMLPTPTTRDWKASISPSGIMRKDGKYRTDVLSNMPVLLGEHCQQRPGKTSQLNPLFVEEMMGFPENWTLLPFLNGETNPSKPTETPSSHK
jgi:hypothetical protein